MNKWFTEKLVLIYLVCIPFLAYGAHPRQTNTSAPITVIGTGYVGLVLGACLADLGHTVTCCDVDQNKIEMLSKGVIPIYEAGLHEMVLKNLESKRLFFRQTFVNRSSTPPISSLQLEHLRGKTGRQIFLISLM